FFTTPLVIFLVLLCLLLGLRKTWGWWLVVVVLAAMTFIRPVFAVAVRHIGFNISRGFPLSSALVLDLTILTTYGADALVRRWPADQHPRTVILAACTTAVVLLLGFGTGLVQGFAVHWEVAALTVLAVGMLAVQAHRPRPFLLIATLIL